MDDERLISLLVSIDRRLALLTGAQERAMRRALRERLLRTPARVAMFEAIDGSRSSPELARHAGVSDRAAQMFVKELLEAGLVGPLADGTGRTILVERDEAAVVQWYLQAEDGLDTSAPA